MARLGCASLVLKLAHLPDSTIGIGWGRFPQLLFEQLISDDEGTFIISSWRCGRRSGHSRLSVVIILCFVKGFDASFQSFEWLLNIFAPHSVALELPQPY